MRITRLRYPSIAPAERMFCRICQVASMFLGLGRVCTPLRSVQTFYRTDATFPQYFIMVWHISPKITPFRGDLFIGSASFSYLYTAHTGFTQHNTTQRSSWVTSASAVNKIIISNVCRLPQTLADSVHAARRRRDAARPPILCRFVTGGVNWLISIASTVLQEVVRRYIDFLWSLCRDVILTGVGVGRVARAVGGVYIYFTKVRSI